MSAALRFFGLKKGMQTIPTHNYILGQQGTPKKVKKKYKELIIKM
jgi:hypothetical protein